MINYLFPSDFYFHSKCPNNLKIIEYIDDYGEKKLNSNQYNWTNNCTVKTLSIQDDEWVRNYLGASVEDFLNEIQYPGGIVVHPPWINLYYYNHFQEVHHHHGTARTHFSAVFFCNTGENFSKFYFSNRMAGLCSNILTPSYLEVQEKMGDYFYPHISTGDIMIFPSHTLHGVTPHKSEITRKTLSFNFTLVDYL